MTEGANAKTELIDMDDYTMGGGDYVVGGRHVRLLGRGASSLCFVYMDEPEPREQVWQGVSQFGEMVRAGTAVKRVEPEAERFAREEAQKKRAELRASGLAKLTPDERVALFGVDELALALEERANRPKLYPFWIPKKD